MSDRRICVTRHRPLVALLIERRIIDATTPVIEHATADDVRDRIVVGVLPIHLAALAYLVIDVPLALTLEDRAAMPAGEIPLERLREIAGPAVAYHVRTPEQLRQGGYET